MACPLWPLHIIIMYVLSLFPIWLMFTGMASAVAEATWKNMTFSPGRVDELVEETHRQVYFRTEEPLGDDYAQGTLQILVTHPEIASVKSFDSEYTNRSNYQPPDIIYLNTSKALTSEPLNLSFILNGDFLGYTEVKVQAYGASNDRGDIRESRKLESHPLPVSVVRKPRIEDKIFIYSVAILMGLNYVNMGSTLDLNIVMSTLRRPIGPAVGMLSQYLFMPLISFGMAYACFDSPALRLGLFTSGCSPGGGASNMWTYLLGGNLNLSITMTFFSNVFAFATMPLWLFTLGGVIFDDSNIKIPYANIVSYIGILVVPVGFGILLQLYFKRVSAFCRRILGPFSIGMIVFIVVFGIYTNLYMFKVFTWQIFLAGFSVPFLGYLFGATGAWVLRFSSSDITAIAIETGVQNTGIAIVLLRLTLPQPDADLTSVVPVALATMTPIPLLLALLFIRVRRWYNDGNDMPPYHLAGSSTPCSEEDETKNADRQYNNGTVNVHM